MSYKEKAHLPDKKSGKVLYLEPKLQYERCFRVRMDSGEVWTLRADTDAHYAAWVDALTTLLTAVEEQLAEGKGVWLEAAVEKRSYWTHSWYPRYLCLNTVDGTITHSTAKGVPPKGKTVVQGADLVLACEQRNEVAFVTANADSFHVRFESSSDASKWVAAVQTLLSQTSGCRWSTVEVTGTDPMLGTSANAHGFNRIGHAMYVLPQTDHVFVFGGRSSKGFSTIDPVLEHQFIPVPPPAASTLLFTADVYHVRFTGDHIANTVQIVPFEEGANAKVRPLPREGCASIGLGSSWLIYGGRGGGGAVLDDVWMISFASLAPSPRDGSAEGGKGPLRWARLTEGEGHARMAGERSLPRLAFHAGVALSPLADGPTSLVGASGAGDGDAALVLFCGGTSDGANATSACWLYDVATGAVKEAPPMDVARAQHSVCILPTSREVVAVGGVSTMGSASASASMCSQSSNPYRAVTPTLSIRSPVNGKWRALETSFVDRCRLPPLPYPCVAVVGHSGDEEATLLISGGTLDCRDLPCLARLTVTSPSKSRPTSATASTASVAMIAALGAAPTVPIGLSLAVFGSYLHTIGGDGIRRLLLSSVAPALSTPVVASTNSGAESAVDDDADIL